MSGPYCQYCGRRCFVDRVVPDGPCAGWRGLMATCGDGMAHDLLMLGHTHLSAINPITAPAATVEVSP